MRVLVTGATGFLGSHVVRVLRARGDSVRAWVRTESASSALPPDVETRTGDLADEPGLRAAARGCDALIHCAARLGHWSRIAAEQRRVNVEGTAAVLRAARSAGVGRIVHVSTIATLGCTRDGSILDESARFEPRTLGIPYVTSKHEAEQRALAAAWAGMDVVVVNPGALFGPRFDGRPISSSVRRVAERRARWNPPGGSSVCDVEDAARGAVAALAHGRRGERYVLGGENVTWRELQAAIARAFGVPPPTLVVPRSALPLLVAGSRLLDLVGLARPPWTPEVFRGWGWTTWVDSSKARAELGYDPRPLAATLQRLAAEARRDA